MSTNKAVAPKKADIANHLAADLREVYLHAFDDFAIDAGDVVDSEYSAGRINNRYARELLGVLVNAELLSIQDVNGETDVWQVATPGTSDNHQRNEAEAAIDAWLAEHKMYITQANKTPTPQKEKPVTAAKPTVGFKQCLCQCGSNVPPKSNYKPGHDARHAGSIGRTLAALDPVERALSTVLDLLPTDALRQKALGIEATAREKAGKKAAKADGKTVHISQVVKEASAAYIAEQKAKPTFVEGKVKIGRRAFPARKWEGGTMEVNENQDGSGEWRDTDLTDAQVASFAEIITEPIDTATT